MLSLLFMIFLTSFSLRHSNLSANAQELIFEVLEEIPPSYLGNIGVKANLTSVLGQQELLALQYTIVDVSSSAHNPFSVSPTSGDLYTEKSLDREGLCGTTSVCTVRCDVAVQSASPESAFFRKFSLVVYILDANDNAPAFSQSSFVVEISEQTPVETTFALPTANDVDVDERHKVQRYTLEPKIDTFNLNVLAYETLSGEHRLSVFLRISQPLDREVNQLYSFSLIAFDGGSPIKTATLPITVNVLDENDNEPVFDHAQYTRVLTEGTPTDSVALVVNARDLDEGDNGRISFHISDTSDTSIKSLFSVKEDTGVITVIGLLGTRGGNTYDFEVLARDAGIPQLSSTCRVIIEIQDTRNDKPEMEVKPLFSHSGAAVVPESAAIGKVTALLTVVDHDSDRNGLVNCNLDNPRFSLQTLELNEYKIIVAQPLDREKETNYTVVITCRDGGKPPLSTEKVLRIEISDSNDNPPVFSSKNYFFSVDENEVVGTWVGSVTATDADFGANSRIVYSMENNGETFTIDTMLGDIYTTRFLDREDKPKYVFIAYAWDSSPSPLTSTTTVVINVGDKNDLRPVFASSSYIFQVQERTPIGTVIGHVTATDGDIGLNAQVEYYMVTSRLIPRMPIGVNASGVIMVSGELDYEVSSMYTFVIAAVDLGLLPQNSSIHVTVNVIDKNDHSPVISFPNVDNPTVTIALDTAPGSEVAKIVAYDLDSGTNGDLTYTISVRNGSNLFVVDPLTGVISLGHQILPSDIRSYDLVVNVRDNGIPQMTQQALLHIEVVSSDEVKQIDLNMKIVIALVCITLALALAVLTTLLLIRYFDRQRKAATERHKHSIINKAKYNACTDMEQEATAASTLFIPQKDQNTLASGGINITKKIVTFEKDKTYGEAKDFEEQDIPKPPAKKVSRETLWVECTSAGNFSTFKPPPKPKILEEQQQVSTH